MSALLLYFYLQIFTLILLKKSIFLVGLFFCLPFFIKKYDYKKLKLFYLIIFLIGPIIFLIKDVILENSFDESYYQIFRHLIIFICTYIFICIIFLSKGRDEGSKIIFLGSLVGSIAGYIILMINCNNYYIYQCSINKGIIDLGFDTVASMTCLSIFFGMIYLKNSASLLYIFLIYFYILLQSGRRAAFIYVIVLFLIFLLKKPYSLKKLFFSGLILVSVLFVSFQTDLSNYYGTALRIVGEIEIDNGDVGRQLLWRNFLEVARDAGFFGGMQPIESSNYEGVPSFHNEFFDTFWYGGWLAIFVFSALLISLSYKFLKSTDYFLIFNWFSFLLFITLGAAPFSNLIAKAIILSFFFFSLSWLGVRKNNIGQRSRGL